jgi:glycosyltransferase involved in cell wall biosynthesis
MSRHIALTYDDGPAPGVTGKLFDILFVSPILPLAYGNGLAMRAWMFLGALAAEHRVKLVVVPAVMQVDPAQALRALQELGVEVVQLPNRTQADAKASAARVLQFVKEGACKTVHIFRLYMIPLVREVLLLPPLLRPMIVLDMDDDEAKTHFRLADHARSLHQPAALLKLKARHTAALENKYLGQCDRIYLCNEADCDAMNQRLNSVRCMAIPNAVSLPQPPAAPGKTSPAYRFLFVGTMGYKPNEDAVLFFCHEILPRIRRAARRPVQFIIAGVNPGPHIQAVANDPEIVVTGFVADLAGLYLQADTVVVPIRVGGGMRIKVLEAFSYHCPVVSTSIGMEGIAAIPDRHLLIADGAGGFAIQCLSLMNDPPLGQRLSTQAYELVCTQYSMAAVQERIRSDYRALLAYGK